MDTLDLVFTGVALGSIITALLTMIVLKLIWRKY